jgi:hypothetical protein
MRVQGVIPLVVVLTMLTAVPLGGPASAAEDARLQRARDALAQKDYSQAVALLDALSQEGIAEAMVLYAGLWEKGHGVPSSRTEALFWYGTAVRFKAKGAQEARDRVARSLPAERVKLVDGRVAKFRPSVSSMGRPMNLAGSAFCSFLDARLGRPGGSAEQLIADITRFGGLAEQNFRVMAGNVPNAAAIVAPLNSACPERWWERGACDLSEGFERLVVYSPAWMDSITQQSGPKDWASYSVLAHEIGHHVQGHTLTPGGSRPPTELQADSYSGFVLAKMGAPLEDATGLMRSMGPNPGSDTHPGTDDRIRAITEGWNQGRSTGVEAGNSPLPPVVIDPDPVRPVRPTDDRRRPVRPPVQPPIQGPISGPMPSPMPMMAFCSTPAGYCPMGIPVPAGYPCWCPSRLGPVNGMVVVQ